MYKLTLKLTIIIILLLIARGCTDKIGASQRQMAFPEITVNYLRCEYKINPLGIDVAEPRLSWVLDSAQRGWVQTAYQILVADSEQILGQDVGNLWDSGKVESDLSNQVVYKGKLLQSRMSCYWKVRVWDRDGGVSPWSEPAFWTMGLLEPADWQAKWIGYDAEPPAAYEQFKEIETLSLSGCKWVWYPEGQPNRRLPNVTRYFRHKVELPDRKIERARFRLIADNDAVMFINGRQVHTFSGWQRPYTFDIAEKLHAGTNTFAFSVTNRGDAASPAGLAGKLLIEFDSAPPVTVAIDSSWKSSQTGPDGWQNEDFKDDNWVNVIETANCGDMPWGNMEDDTLDLPPTPFFRKGFSVDGPVRRATVYATALGLYELHINGKRVGGDYFTPGWTDYNKRLYYQSYNVTEMLDKGGNAIGAILADGWYAGYLGSKRRKALYGKNPRLFVQLEIEYADGGRKIIATDNTWKANYGPIVEADFLMGETYDARKEMPGWDRGNFDDSGWNKVGVFEKWPGTLQSYPGVTVRKMLEVKTKKVTEPKKGVCVFDMGQNFAGFVRLKAKGKAGTKIVMRFAERLNPDGTIYTMNLRGARCTDTYVLKGSGEEIWEPHFTYHGFQYVEVAGYPGTPGPDAVTGVVVYSNMPSVASFECSNPMVNQLYSNIVWGQRSNFIEIPTDCPQRDERLGWTGDAQIFIRTATYNMDVAAFFTKWLVDLEDDQSAEGAFPDVAPRKTATGDGTAAWGDAGVICPWTIYQVYGDKRVLEKHYDAMKKWIAYLQQHSTDLLRPASGYGDWVSIASDTPKDVIATAYFAYITNLVSKTAALLGKQDEAKKYNELYEQIKAAFNKAYVSEDGHIKGDTQTCYVLGLHFDLLPQDKRPLATQHLIETLEAKNWHLSTGFVGLSYLLPVLTETGHTDIAYRLLTNDTFPSWGYSIKNGATTIWERWDGWTEDKGFQDPGMNSFNHYSFGAVGRWLFGTVAGIDTDGPGFKKIIIRPSPGEITSTKASYDSINGKIAVDWKLEGGTFTLDVTIPANTTATVYVPAESPETVTESGRKIAEAEAVQLQRMEGGSAVFSVGSGHYQFVSKQL
jgi:alpha-L-rhamnosidase